MRPGARICLFALAFWGYSIANAQSLIVCTFNLRYDNASDTGNLWRDRVKVIAPMARFHGFDILCTQEGLSNQLEDLAAALPEYGKYGVGRDDGKDAGEHSAIFFNRDKFALIDFGDFWLSQTPEKPSMGWDARCCKRLCTWIRLKTLPAGNTIFVFNAHFDHEGVVAREQSSLLVLEQIKRIAGANPVIFTSDLNGGRTSSWYTTIARSGLVDDTYTKSQVVYQFNPTYQSFGAKLQGNEVIDHIFASHAFSVERWGVLSDSYHGKYPSDHFPVLAELILK